MLKYDFSSRIGHLFFISVITLALQGCNVGLYRRAQVVAIEPVASSSRPTLALLSASGSILTPTFGITHLEPEDSVQIIRDSDSNCQGGAIVYGGVASSTEMTATSWKLGDNDYDSTYRIRVIKPDGTESCGNAVSFSNQGLVRSNAVALTGGDYFHCALLGGADAGKISCWGNNGYGQHGDGTNTTRATAVTIAHADSYSQIDSGYHSTCGIVASGTDQGKIKCWGHQWEGRLGDGNSINGFSLTPITVLNVSDAVQVAVAVSHSRAVIGGVGTDAGKVKCWGSGANGRLGDGTSTHRYSPVEVSGVTDAVSVAVNNGTSCAIIGGSGADAGKVKCWGYNGDGQLGDGTTTERSAPVESPGLFGATQIVVGDQFVCGLLTSDSGKVKCSGLNSSGQLGDGTLANSSTPVYVSGLSEVSQLAAKNSHVCAVIGSGAESGKLKCWGYNGFAQLGDETYDNRSTPVTVALDADEVAVGVTAAAESVCVLLGGSKAGQVKCWGDNCNGQLGDGSNTARAEPMPLSGLLSKVTDLTMTSSGGCALLGGVHAGKVQCWGANDKGQAGNGTVSFRVKTPTLVTGLSGVTQLEAGTNHYCAVIGSGVDAGKVKCWGFNGDGGLGDGTQIDRSTPVEVAGLTNVSQVTAGYSFSCALIGSGTDAGKVKCWGRNTAGQLGDGTTDMRLAPTVVPGLTGVAEVAAGNSHACAWIGTGTNAGKTYCWGFNTYAQVGDGTNTHKLSPTEVSNLAGIRKLALGDNHSCALVDAGTDGNKVRCWGHNDIGQAGDGTGTQRKTPVDVIGDIKHVVSLAVGQANSCVVMKQGSNPTEMRCWGYNVGGRLGDGTTTHRKTPVIPIGGKDAVKVSTHFNTCVITRHGYTVDCWGSIMQGDYPSVISGVPIGVLNTP